MRSRSRTIPGGFFPPRIHDLLYPQINLFHLTLRNWSGQSHGLNQQTAADRERMEDTAWPFDESRTENANSAGVSFNYRANPVTDYWYTISEWLTPQLMRECSGWRAVNKSERQERLKFQKSRRVRARGRSTLIGDIKVITLRGYRGEGEAGSRELIEINQRASFKFEISARSRLRLSIDVIKASYRYRHSQFGLNKQTPGSIMIVSD